MQFLFFLGLCVGEGRRLLHGVQCNAPRLVAPELDLADHDEVGRGFVQLADVQELLGVGRRRVDVMQCDASALADVGLDGDTKGRDRCRSGIQTAPLRVGRVQLIVIELLCFSLLMIHFVRRGGDALVLVMLVSKRE